MATILGFLTVKIGADTDPLKDKSKEAEGILKGLGDTAKGTTLAIAAITAASITAAVALGVHLTRSALETIDTQSKLAYRLGGTVAAIQTLQHAADLSGTSLETLTKAAGMFNLALAVAARTGEGPAANALDRLKLRAQDLLKLDLDQRFIVIGERMKELGYTTAQQSEVLKAFQIRGQALLMLFEGGGETIRDARKDIKDFGLELTRIDGVKVEQANDAWKRARLILEGVGHQLAIQLSPFIKEAGDKLADAGRQAGGFGKLVGIGIKSAIESVAEFGGYIYDLRLKLISAEESWLRFKTVFTTNPLTGASFSEFKAALETIRLEAEKARKELGDRPDPKGMIAYFDDIQKRAEAAAKAVADARDESTKPPKSYGDRFTDEQKKALNDRLLNLKKEIESEDLALLAQKNKQIAETDDLARKQFISKQVASELKLQIDTKYEKQRKELVQSLLEETILTEQELNNRAYEKRLRDLDLFEKNKTITTQNANEIRKKLEQKHAIDIAQITARQYSTLAGIVDTSLSQISQVLGKEGGAAFEIMKAISYATAVVKGYEAVVSAYAAGSAVGGPPLGAAFAAVAAAGVAAQIAAIASTRPNSATGASPSANAPASSAASENAAPAAGPNSGQTLRVQGLNPTHLFTGEAVRQIAGALVQYQRDGGTVVYES